MERDLVERPVGDLALFNLAIDSKLRGCDLVSLRVEDVAPHGQTLDRATVRQRKTGWPVKFEITEQTRQAIDEYLLAADKKPGNYLFSSRRNRGGCLTTRQYARLLSEWIAGIGLDPSMFGTHSLRRTRASLIYKRTGNLRAVQLLLGHTRWRAPSGISASKSMMRWRSPSRWISKARGGAISFRSKPQEYCVNVRFAPCTSALASVPDIRRWGEK